MSKPKGPTHYETAVVEPKKWDGVALWHWGGDHVEQCAICRNQIMHLCIECQASQGDQECKVAWGACQHVFHYHCIERWLRTRKVCPIDNINWEFRQVSDSNS